MSEKLDFTKFNAFFFNFQMPQDNYRVNSVKELEQLAKVAPNAAIKGLVFDGKFNPTDEIMDKTALNVFKDACMFFDIQEASTGVIPVADWKNLERLTVAQYDTTQPSMLQDYGLEKAKFWLNFDWNGKYHFDLPSLQKINLYLIHWPIHYFSLIDLLFRSPHLYELKIYSVTTILVDFDEGDFKNRLKDQTFKKMKTLQLECKYRPIIPFESLKLLVAACPALTELMAGLNDKQDMILSTELGFKRTDGNENAQAN